ncbi:hypothetical protein B4900_20610 [Yersinia rohdei]|nr:hypothetical protein B4900_20610 [Yersinia rohdei]
MLHKITNLRKSFFVAMLCLLFAIVLFPYWKNGFWDDDALNSQTWGMVHRFNSSVWEFSYRVSRAWFVDAGRILFPWPAIYSFFYVLRDELAVRLADMAMFIGHIGITVLLLRRVGISWRTVGLFALILLALLQIRGSGDPLAAFAGFSQGVGILLMLSLLLLHKWHETQGTGWLAASSLLAALSMTCYEINVVYIPIALVAVLASRHRRVLRDVAIVVLPFAIFMAASIYAKHMVLNPYPGSALGQLSAVPATFLKQLVATLPGSYYVLLGRHEYPLAELLRAASTSPLAWGVMILWSALAIMVLRLQATQQPALRMAVFAAWMLLLVPPVLLSISAKYQSELIWGTSHVPVYYQCFGLAFLAAAAVERLSTGRIAKLVTVFVPLIGIGVALSLTINMHQSARMDSVFREPRDSLVSALHNGLFDSVRDGDVVLIEGQPMFINGNLIYQVIGKNVSIPDEIAIAGWFESLPRPDAKRYRLFRDPASNNQWKLQEQ